MYNDIVDGRQCRIEMPLCVYSDPLDQPDDELFERYHFRMESILFLLQTLAIQARPTNRSNPVPPIYALLLALWFYATGSFYNIVGDALMLSQATVCRCVKRVTEALCQQVNRHLSTFDETQQSDRGLSLVSINLWQVSI